MVSRKRMYVCAFRCVVLAYCIIHNVIHTCTLSMLHVYQPVTLFPLGGPSTTHFVVPFFQPKHLHPILPGVVITALDEVCRACIYTCTAISLTFVS